MPASARAAAGKSQGACPQLSPVSQLFLGMGDNAPDIYAIMRVRGRPSLDEVAVAMQQLCDAHDRFRMRVVCRMGTWCTEIVDKFDVRWCMREALLEGADIDEAFNNFVARLMSGAPLSEGALPPWDCSVVHYTSDPNHTDVLLRCSHMIGDGQLFMQLLKDVLDEVEDEEVAAPATGFSGGGANPSPPASADGSDSDSLSSAPTSGRASPSGSLRGGSSAGGSASGREGSPLLIRAVRHQSAFLPPPSMERAERRSARRTQEQSEDGARPEPSHIGGQRAGRQRRGFVQQAWRALMYVWGWLTSALFVLTMPIRFPDPVNAVKASGPETGGPRAFASITLPLEEMRHISKLLGVTINTLAVSCLAGGLRRYLIQSGGGGARRWPWRRGGCGSGSGSGGGSTSGVPSSLLLCSLVDTRAMKRMGMGMGIGGGSNGGCGCNTLSFIGVPVNTGDAEPLVRLASVSSSLSWIRSSLAVLMAVLMPPVVQFFVRDAALAAQVILFLLPCKTTMGFSNMRGPVKRVALRGYPVERMYNGVQPNAFGCFISLMSYDDQVTLVNSCYASKSQRPELLLECVREEWHALRGAATSPAPFAPEAAGAAAGKGAKVKAA